MNARLSTSVVDCMINEEQQQRIEFFFPEQRFRLGWLSHRHSSVFIRHRSTNTRTDTTTRKVFHKEQKGKERKLGFNSSFWPLTSEEREREKTILRFVQKRRCVRYYFLQADCRNESDCSSMAWFRRLWGSRGCPNREICFLSKISTKEQRAIAGVIDASGMNRTTTRVVAVATTVELDDERTKIEAVIHSVQIRCATEAAMRRIDYCKSRWLRRTRRSRSCFRLILSLSLSLCFVGRFDSHRSWSDARDTKRPRGSSGCDQLFSNVSLTFSVVPWNSAQMDT